MRNTPTFRLTIPAFLFVAGCAVSEPVDATHVSNSALPIERAAEQMITGSVQAEFCGVVSPVPTPFTPGFVSVASFSPATLTHTTSNWSSCTMTFVAPDGSGGSFPWPTDASGTVGAGSGAFYTLTCTANCGTTPIFSATAAVRAL